MGYHYACILSLFFLWCNYYFINFFYVILVIKWKEPALCASPFTLLLYWKSALCRFQHRKLWKLHRKFIGTPIVALTPYSILSVGWFTTQMKAWLIRMSNRPHTRLTFIFWFYTPIFFQRSNPFDWRTSLWKTQTISFTTYCIFCNP